MKKKTQLFFLIWLLSAGLGAGAGWLIYESDYSIAEMLGYESIIAILIGIGVGTVIGIIVILMIKSVSGKNTTSNIIKTKSEKHDSIADELQKYKCLLDDGAITIEEFEEMKAKLLNQ